MPVISYLRGDLGIDHHHHRIKGNSRWLARCRLNRRRRRRRRRRQRNRRGKKKRRNEGGKEKKKRRIGRRRNSCFYSTLEVNERTTPASCCAIRRVERAFRPFCAPALTLPHLFSTNGIDQTPNTKYPIAVNLQPFNKRDETGCESIIDLLRK